MTDSSNEINPEGSTLHYGASEVEIITFYLNWLDAESGLERKTFYGINAGKVMELVAMPEKLTILHERFHPSLKGVFLLRNHTIPLIDLCEWFGYEKSNSSGQRLRTVIVTEMNGKRFGFLTHGVDKVHRVSWSGIKPPPEMIADCKSLTGICLVEGQIIQMVDFEHILEAIDPSLQISSRVQETMKVSHAERNKGKTVVVAEDSRTILHQMREMLECSGFKVVSFADGEAAWHYLKEVTDGKDSNGKAIAAIISDIEMPRMNGLSLCSLVRDNAELKHLPFILFSSMINEAQSRKGRSVGVTDQVTKPEIDQLVERLEACLG